MKNCSCLKILETYAVIEKNLLKIIDLLQYEKKCIIEEYNTQMSNIEKRLMSKELKQNIKLQSLSSEILHQKIVNHELKNSLKIAEENLKFAFVKSNGHLALKNNKIFPIDLERIHNINMLVNKLYSKISRKFKQSELRDAVEACEIQNIFKSIWSEIKIITKEQGSKGIIM